MKDIYHPSNISTVLIQIVLSYLIGSYYNYIVLPADVIKNDLRPKHDYEELEKIMKEVVMVYFKAFPRMTKKNHEKLQLVQLVFQSTLKVCIPSQITALVLNN
jgi:hypothetical protein